MSTRSVDDSCSRVVERRTRIRVTALREVLVSLFDFFVRSRCLIFVV